MGPGKHPSDVTAKRNIQPMFLLLLIAPKQKNFASRKIGSLCGVGRKADPALFVVGRRGILPLASALPACYDEGKGGVFAMWFVFALG